MEISSEKNADKERTISSLKREIEELNLKLIRDKQKFETLKSEVEISKLIYSQEIQNYEREIISLKDNIGRLKDELKVYKGRAQKDQELIASLFGKIRDGEKEFSEKIFALRTTNFDLECCNRRITDELHAWKAKFDVLKEKEKMKQNQSQKNDTEVVVAGSVKKRGVDVDATTDERMQVKTTKRGRDIYDQRNGLNSSSNRILTPMERAELFQGELMKSDKPSFIKIMFPSNVSGCFKLGIPLQLCKANLPAYDHTDMILKDEGGSEFETRYNGYKFCFTGGWRHFSEAHKLKVGDVLVFELTRPAKFKVYVVKSDQESDTPNMHNGDSTSHKGSTNKHNGSVTMHKEIRLKRTINKPKRFQDSILSRRS